MSSLLTLHSFAQLPLGLLSTAVRQFPITAGFLFAIKYSSFYIAPDVFGETGEMAKTTVFFVVDGDKLEAQACFLAPTLKKYLQGDVDIVSYRRADNPKDLSPITQEIFAKSGVSVRLIPQTSTNDQDPWLKPYRIGHKILASSDSRDSENAVFLDTDTALVNPVNYAELLEKTDVGAVVSDYSTVSNDAEGWTAFYGLFGLSLPKERVRLYSGRKLRTPPYFNGGAVLFKERIGPEKAHFGQSWLEDALRFEREINHPYSRANIDQLTLPLTAARVGSPVTALPQALNFNIQAHGNAPGVEKTLVHYHRVGILWNVPQLGRSVLRCLYEIVGAHSLREIRKAFLPDIRYQRLKRLLGDPEAPFDPVR